MTDIVPTPTDSGKTYEELAAERCTCGHRRGQHADSSGLCWVGYGLVGPPCECMLFDLASEGA